MQCATDVRLWFISPAVSPTRSSISTSGPTEATGFGFRTFAPEEAVKTVRRAMRVHRTSRKEWKALQRRGMTSDLSWASRRPRLHHHL